MPAGEHVAVAAEVDPAQAVGALWRSRAHVTVLLRDSGLRIRSKTDRSQNLPLRKKSGFDSLKKDLDLTL